jgi:hypothetical protein
VREELDLRVVARTLIRRIDVYLKPDASMCRTQACCIDESYVGRT